MLDFACAHTEQTDKGQSLTLTIWGQAESTTVKNVSNMSLHEIAGMWTVCCSLSHDFKASVSDLDRCLLMHMLSQHRLQLITHVQPDLATQPMSLQCK